MQDWLKLIIKMLNLPRDFGKKSRVTIWAAMVPGNGGAVIEKT